MQALARADVFAINGAGMESFLTRVTDQLPDLQILDSSAGIPVLQSGEGGAESENPLSMGQHFELYQASGKISPMALRRTTPRTRTRTGKMPLCISKSSLPLRSRMHEDD